ncbi:MAG: IS66 family insertion sequence element accessory protein TnpB [Proteobacteria bacterium]|jgi:transposase|nr:IS66 family insertion sequence element accessory protein TnpB [Pseudomonadota bacterium]
MFFDPRQRCIWLYRDPVDMRKGHNSLSYLVTHVVLRDLMSGDIFLFVSKDRKSLKAIVWDGSGLCLFHKRLNRGRVMSFLHLSKENEITAQDFTLIIGGAKVTLNISLKSN